MSVLRVALCADFPEERWPSMDRVANELLAQVSRNHSDAVELTPICPPFARRATRMWPAGRSFTVDRALNRWWDYPRHAKKVASEYELFHIVDHSYSQLVHRLPAGRTIVTCHDLDTFRSVLIPEDEPRSAIFQMATRRILSGLKRAALVTCDTAAVREELLGFGLVPPERVSVVPVGVGDGFSPDADERADAAAGRLVATAPGSVEILHVGSTSPRKRVDSLLEICAALVPSVPELHLVRVGGPFSAEAAADDSGWRTDRPRLGHRVRRRADAGGPVPARRAGPAAVGARRVWPAAARGDGLRHAGGRERSAGVEGSGRLGRRVLSGRRD